MTDKIAVDRDFLEHAVVALEYAYSADDEMVQESIKYLRAALRAEQPVAAQPADQLRAYGEAVRAEERERWEAAMKQAWSMIDPFNPAGVPGSYARGQDSGIVDALTTVRANYVAAAAIRSAAPPQCIATPPEPRSACRL